MEKTLHDIWYDPKTGFTSSSVLLKRAKVSDPTITKKQVNEWLAKQRTAQLHKPARKGKSPGAIVSFNPGQRWQADLIDMQQYTSYLNRRRMHWILIVVDVFTRRLFARALPTKEVENVASAFNEIIEEAKQFSSGRARDENVPYNLDTDNGSEFAKTFDKETPALKHWRANIGDHRALGVVDATIRIFKNLLFRSMTDKGNDQWAKNLNSLVENYNTTPKEPLFDYTPYQIESDEKLQDLIRILNQDKFLKMKKEHDKVPFEVGDKVRIPIQSGPFKRGFKKQQSDKTYPITKVNAQSVIVDVEGQPRRYLFSEINRTGVALSEDVYEIEEVLDEERQIKRGKKIIKQFKVKFKGYDEPEWVDEGDIITESD